MCSKTGSVGIEKRGGLAGVGAALFAAFGLELSPADLARWENSEELENLQAEWVREAGAAGLEDAAAIMDQVRALHAEAMRRSAQ